MLTKAFNYQLSRQLEYRKD